MVYRKISQTEIQATGNVRLPKKPSYFDFLVDHFGGWKDMAHRCLSFSELALLPDEDDAGSEGGVNVVSRRNLNFSSPAAVPSARPATTGSKNDNIIEVGKDIKEGLVQMSDRIASALITPQPSLSNDLQEIKSLLKSKCVRMLKQTKCFNDKKQRQFSLL
jgi:hypothetical protein